MSTIDPFTFEVLRHRLWTINVEGALALQSVSGSPLATEAFDMNTSLMTRVGEVVFVGPYLLTGPMGQGLIVRNILDSYVDNPGVEPGDMFICNDPYSGAAHQNCVTLVAPIHADDELIAWCGATLHVIDVGGSTAGQVGVGASSIYEEAPVIPPLKIVRGGHLLRDVEANYLRRSRTAALNALDLRGKMAALNTIKKRIAEMVARHGAEALEYVMDTVIDRSEATLRRRLSALPDGSFEHTAFLDRGDVDPPESYAVNLQLEKSGDSLLFDWTRSSPQAGAVVNCTRSGLLSGVLIGVLTYLGYDTDWTPAAVERVVEIRSEPGTIVDARWPAGCSMATMAAGFAATTATAVCLGRLLATAEDVRDRAMATWAGAVGSVDMFGVDTAGRPYGTVLLDSMISGTGARPVADGIDGGGFLRSIGCLVANIETYEARFPILYLHRRLLADTGGPGRFRGGVGCSYAIMANGVPAIGSITPHFSGTQQPESVGLLGGYPGAVNRPYVTRATDVRKQFASGVMPVTPDELGGEMSATQGIAHLSLAATDVFGVIVTGGGGWGDPLERDPGRVAKDVSAFLVGRRAAREIYGVTLAPDGTPDLDATTSRRNDLRRQRSQRTTWGELPYPGGGPTAPGEVDENAQIVVVGGRSRFKCGRCGHESGMSSGYRSALVSSVRPLSVAGPYAGPADAESGFELAEWCCPNCWRVVDVERVEKDGERLAHG